MARTKTAAKADKPSKAVTKTAQNTSIATIDSELEQFGSNISAFVAQASGNKIKVTPAGDFVLPSGENLGGEIQATIINFAAKNIFYPPSKPYIEGQLTAPDCYAIGHVKNEDLIPEDDSPNLQHDNCGSCPMGGRNAFKTGRNGKGKACQNRYLVALLLIDADDPEAANDPAAPVYILDVAPTSIKAFEGAVNTAFKTLGSHPVKAIFTLRANPMGTYSTIDFIDPVPNPNYALHYQRGKDVEDILMRKPDFAAIAAAEPASRSRAKPRTAARR